MELGDEEYASVVFARVRRLLIREGLRENLPGTVVGRVRKLLREKRLEGAVGGQQEGWYRANMAQDSTEGSYCQGKLCKGSVKDFV